MSTAKQEVRLLLDGIPDDATFEDIQYHIDVREKIERGLKDVEEGRVVSEDGGVGDRVACLLLTDLQAALQHLAGGCQGEALHMEFNGVGSGRPCAEGT